jgi:hypothetical protein
MSLGKLLTTGKSLVGLSHANSRYQLQKGALPKFESAKNPFAKANAELPEREPQLPKLTPAEEAAADLKKTHRLPVLAALIAVREASVALSRNSQETQLAPTQTSPAQTARTQSLQVPTPVDSWLKKVNPLVWFGKNKPAEPKAAIPRFGKSSSPVQGELSLENIKVMRNDLSETDVEIVRAKSRPPKMIAAPMQGSVAAAMAIPDLPPATRVWEFLGEHMLGKD